MQLDGFPINVGNSVYDVSVNRGWGKVVYVSAGEICEVAFPNKLRVKYGESGIQAGSSMKTLAWHNPFDIIIPLKDAQDLAAQKRVLDVMREQLTLARNGRR